MVSYLVETENHLFRNYIIIINRLPQDLYKKKKKKHMTIKLPFRFGLSLKIQQYLGYIRGFIKHNNSKYFVTPF